MKRCVLLLFCMVAIALLLCACFKVYELKELSPEFPSQGYTSFLETKEGVILAISDNNVWMDVDGSVVIVSEETDKDITILSNGTVERICLYNGNIELLMDYEDNENVIRFQQYSAEQWIAAIIIIIKYEGKKYIFPFLHYSKDKAEAKGHSLSGEWPFAYALFGDTYQK